MEAPIRLLDRWQAKGNEIQTANLKLLDEGVAAREGEKVPLSVKDLPRASVHRTQSESDLADVMQDMGAAEVFPQYIAHHPNGTLNAPFRVLAPWFAPDFLLYRQAVCSLFAAMVSS